MTRAPDTLPADLGQRILDLARIAAAIHEAHQQHQQSMTPAGGTGDKPSMDGDAIGPANADFLRRLPGRIR
jgi:hypothetical protein